MVSPLQIWASDWPAVAHSPALVMSREKPIRRKRKRRSSHARNGGDTLIRAEVVAHYSEGHCASSKVNGDYMLPLSSLRRLFARKKSSTERICTGNKTKLLIGCRSNPGNPICSATSISPISSRPVQQLASSFPNCLYRV